MTQPGSISHQLVSQIDIMATLASVVDFELPVKNAAEDSHDLLPLLQGKDQVVRTNHVHNTNRNSYALRDGDWVLVAAKSGYHSGKYQQWEKKRGYAAQSKEPKLYNLKEDIGQKNDLAEKHPEKVKEMTALLMKIREQGYSAPRLEK